MPFTVYLSGLDQTLVLVATCWVTDAVTFSAAAAAAAAAAMVTEDCVEVGPATLIGGMMEGVLCAEFDVLVWVVVEEVSDLPWPVAAAALVLCPVEPSVVLEVVSGPEAWIP